MINLWTGLAALAGIAGVSNHARSRDLTKRDFYSAPIAEFRSTTRDQILGQLVRSNSFPLEQTQLRAWLEEIEILQNVLLNRVGYIYFEYAIPRMGKRIDVILVT